MSVILTRTRNHVDAGRQLFLNELGRERGRGLRVIVRMNVRMYLARKLGGGWRAHASTFLDVRNVDR